MDRREMTVPDAYMQKLERRIHRQREQLRRNETSGMWRLSAGYHKLREAVMDAFHQNNERRVAAEDENAALRADLEKVAVAANQFMEELQEDSPDIDQFAWKVLDKALARPGVVAAVEAAKDG